MGFVAGALGDIQRRWETRRAEEAEARKEARLAAIRAEERSQDYAIRKDLAEQELSARAAILEKELAVRKEMQTEEIESRKSISAAENAARMQIAREERAARIEAARISASGSGQREGRSASMKTYRGEKSGRTVNLDMNDPKDVATLKNWQRSESVLPFSPALMDVEDPADDGGGRPYGPRTQPPAQSSFAYDFVKYPKTGKPPQ